jgi:protein pelota
MHIVKFYHGEGVMRLKLDTLEDLWTVQRIVFPDDLVKSKSLRKFKANETDIGELKEVIITLRVEKTELDKNALRLRIMGKIVEGKPEQYIRLNSYHTLNIAPSDTLDIIKGAWPDYLVDVIRNAVGDTKKPRLGIIMVDDEKALPAYLLGYGMEFRNEIYSNLSKRMTQKDFQEQQRKFYEAITGTIKSMDVDTVIVAGPGFTKDDVRAYIEAKQEKIDKRIIYQQASNTERSGVYEIIRSSEVENLLRSEHIRSEFAVMEEFLKGLSSGTSKYGISNVAAAIDDYAAGTLIVNDSMLGNQDVQKILAKAESMHIKIEIFNSMDEVGSQLASFKGIASIA